MRLQIYSRAAFCSMLNVEYRANTFASIDTVFLRKQSKAYYFMAKLLYTDKQIIETSSTKGLVNVHHKRSIPLIISPSLEAGDARITFCSISPTQFFSICMRKTGHQLEITT